MEEAVLLLAVTGDANRGFEIEVQSELSPEIVEALLRQAADEVSGKNDRATGAWGR